MESYQKIFAIELNAGRSDIRNAIVQTLFGRKITKCLFCGALTEIPDSQNTIQNLIIYDPTGIFNAQYHRGSADIAAVLKEMVLPAFVLCSAGIRSSAGTCMPMIESIVPVSRDTRDRFVLAAADDLIRHLTSSPDISGEHKNQICRMAEKAVSTVQTVTPHSPSSETADSERVENLILACCDNTTTVSVEELITTLNDKGISRDTTLAGLVALINTGECYQPKPDTIRRL